MPLYESLVDNRHNISSMSAARWTVLGIVTCAGALEPNPANRLNVIPRSQSESESVSELDEDEDSLSFPGVNKLLECDPQIP